jgi:hypothetical protein
MAEDKKQNTTSEESQETKAKLSKKVAENAKAVFKAHPKEKTVLATSDGNIFLLKDKNSAQNHARKDGRVKREKALEIIEVSRSDI